jgi:DNA repair protein RadC
MPAAADHPLTLVSFTRQMARAGALLGVPLVDHLVVARRGYFSFAEASMLDG